jgi:hypothetical protein
MGLTGSAHCALVVHSTHWPLLESQAGLPAFFFMQPSVGTPVIPHATHWVAAHKGLPGSTHWSLAVHPTHRPLFVSHANVPTRPAQSELPVHFAQTPRRHSGLSDGQSPSPPQVPSASGGVMSGALVSRRPPPSTASPPASPVARSPRASRAAQDEPSQLSGFGTVWGARKQPETTNIAKAATATLVTIRRLLSEKSPAGSRRNRYQTCSKRDCQGCGSGLQGVQHQRAHSSPSR